jgi:hypothetical protein
MFGDDFQLQDAEKIYPVIDAVIAAVNAAGNTTTPPMRIHYSTTDRYWAAVYKEQNPNGPSQASIARQSLRARADVRATPVLFGSRPNWDFMPLECCEFPGPVRCFETMQSAFLKGLTQWVGFFTSRPEFKGLFHYASGVWRAAQQLHALARDNGMPSGETI